MARTSIYGITNTIAIAIRGRIIRADIAGIGTTIIIGIHRIIKSRTSITGIRNTVLIAIEVVISTQATVDAVTYRVRIRIV